MFGHKKGTIVDPALAVLIFLAVVLLCAILGDLFAELLRAGAVYVSVLPAGRFVPGIHWLGASLGASLPLAPLAALLALFSQHRGDWIAAAVLFAGAVGAVVDLPFSIARNLLAGRSVWRSVIEVLVLGLVAAVLFAWSVQAYKLAKRPESWGAPG